MLFYALWHLIYIQSTSVHIVQIWSGQPAVRRTCSLIRDGVTWMWTSLVAEKRECTPNSTQVFLEQRICDHTPHPVENTGYKPKSKFDFFISEFISGVAAGCSNIDDCIFVFKIERVCCHV